MLRLLLKTVCTGALFLSASVYAEALPDVYSICVDRTIKQLKLEGINNAVVEVCSSEAQTFYEKQIVNLLDRINKQSQEFQQPERYTDILKSQRLWKSYVDVECDNAGRYIGSPMYGFCPMKAAEERVKQLQEYAAE